MIDWNKYYRVIKQTPVCGCLSCSPNGTYPYPKGHRAYQEWEEINTHDQCLVIEMGTGVEDGWIRNVQRNWDMLPKYPSQKYGDSSRWLFSEGKLVGCAYGIQDWFANDHDCGDPECGKEWGGSAHSRNCNAFCSNDDAFSVTSLQLSLMFAKELHRISTRYISDVQDVLDIEALKEVQNDNHTRTS